MNELVMLTTDDVNKGRVVADSMIIAIKTNRDHANIQRLILKYEDDLNFFDKVRTEIRPTKSGQSIKIYILTEEQATFLVTLMRNTPEVLIFKRNLVKQFYIMRQELLARKETRLIGKQVRFSLTDSIKDYVTDDGKFKSFAYSNYTKLVYKTLFGKTVKKLKEDRGLTKNENLRDFLTIEELNLVQALESKIASYIEMRSEGTTDKEVYQEVKKYVESLEG